MFKQPRIAVSEIKIIFEPKVKPSERYKVTCSGDSYKLLLENWDINTIWLFEEFKIVLLNRGGRVLGIFPLSKGGLNGTVADPRIVFMIALRTPTAAIILAHNHPSGKIEPSETDKALTAKIRNAGLFFDIKINDHIILNPDEYYSFADNGLI